eukprot:CAMPEP_0194040508 /NCGR_PEP_ID=MMETSP0009_2-20130614/12485_1 /TAXON_ID=210454 /ORGANISM="Grammatophora oceanica, Strain CCMP 410" /LENGTH=99 /DNA_ID=CAMNT_0038683665 /DNA_START=547 /DNA_END=843 /DNA_ORIENTATION=+
MATHLLLGMSVSLIVNLAMLSDDIHAETDWKWHRKRDLLRLQNFYLSFPAFPESGATSEAYSDGANVLTLMVGLASETLPEDSESSSWHIQAVKDPTRW